MLVMNEERIKLILGCRDPRLKEIHDRILEIYEELKEADEIIESISIKKPELGSLGGVTGGIKPDLSDVLIKHQITSRERSRCLKEEMYQLVLEEEAINRVWICFRQLRGLEYRCIELLYVQRLPYKAAEAESGVSHGTFEKKRSSGMKKILHLYQSRYSNLDIVKHRTENKITPARKKQETDKKKPENEIYKQLELTL